MSQEDIESLMKIDNYVDTEEVFEEDDTSEELSRVYDEHSWPEDDPTGYSFKGKKKLFIKAVESLKIVMKKGNQKVIDDVTFKVLDSSSCFSFVKKCEHRDLVLSLMRAMMLERLASLTMSLLTWAPAASSLARWPAHLSGLAWAGQVGGQVHGQRVWPVDRRVEVPPLSKHLHRNIR